MEIDVKFAAYSIPAQTPPSGAHAQRVVLANAPSDPLPAPAPGHAHAGFAAVKTGWNMSHAAGTSSRLTSRKRRSWNGPNDPSSSRRSSKFAMATARGQPSTRGPVRPIKTRCQRCAVLWSS